MKKTHVFVAWPGRTANPDLVDHIHITLRLAPRAADVERRRHAALQHMDQRKPLADFDILQMGRVRPGAGRSAVRQVVGGKEVGFRGVIKNIIAGVDAGMKVRIDKSRRDQTSFGIDFLVHWSYILGTGEFDAIPLEDHHAVFDYLMRLTIEADHPAALDQCFHWTPFKMCSPPGGFTYPRVPLETRSFPIAAQKNCRKGPPPFF